MQKLNRCFNVTFMSDLLQSYIAKINMDTVNYCNWTHTVEFMFVSLLENSIICLFVVDLLAFGHEFPFWFNIHYLSFYRLWLNISQFSSSSHMESLQLVWCTQLTVSVICVTSKNITPLLSFRFV